MTRKPRPCLPPSLVAGLTLVLWLACAHEAPKDPAPAPRAARLAAATPRAAARPTPPPPAPVAAAAPKDAAIYFDFDSSALRDDARSALQKVAADAKSQRETLVIEGNCDELGTVEYNLALGEQRARSAKDYLSHMGVAPDRIRTLSYGSQRPRYPGHDDGSRARNRRDDIRVQ
jgi:peptidoglycan-associated lipoprotein